MAKKKKNPNRVRAGKKAAAKMKREGTGIFASNKKSSRGGYVAKSKKGKSTRPKLISLSKAVTVTGGVIAITGLGMDATDRLIGDLNDILDIAGLSMVVSGATIVLIVNVLKGLGTLVPWFGRKYRAFLRGYGLRP